MGRPGMTARFVPTASGPAAVGGGGAGGGGGGGGLYQFANGESFTFNAGGQLSLIHISEPTRPRLMSYAVF